MPTAGRPSADTRPVIAALSNTLTAFVFDFSGVWPWSTAINNDIDITSQKRKRPFLSDKMKSFLRAREIRRFIMVFPPFSSGLDRSLESLRHHHRLLKRQFV